jgi:hypothetical protein
MLLLVAGTSAAFAITQSLKDERSPVGVPRFDRVLAPTCDCPTDVARLELRLRRADRITATIVNADGMPVRTLAERERVRRGPLELVWNGRDDAGTVVPEGRYRLKIQLGRENRTLLLPTTIRIDTTAPTVRIVGVRVKPDGRVSVVYRTNDRAAADLAVRGERLPETVVVRGRFRPAGRDKLNWSGRIESASLPPGRYTLVLRARDPAGNISEPATAEFEALAGAAP